MINPFSSILRDMKKRYYNSKTAQLKNETEFFKEIYNDIVFINQERQRKGRNKYIIFEETENGKYSFYDELNGQRHTADYDLALIFLVVDIKIIKMRECNI